MRWVIVRSRAGALALLAALTLMTFVGADPKAAAQQSQTIRWDLVNLLAGQVLQGGEASARAEDGTRITLTGKGTFTSGLRGEVTGGGTWTTQNAKGDLTGSGSYAVTELISWHGAVGTPAVGIVNRIGKDADKRAGVAVLRIRYSNGSDGMLVVSCHGDVSPDTIFEGIIASMGFVQFWNREAPRGGVNANRTIFHVARE